MRVDHAPGDRRPRSVLITGGAGFVGAHLAARCLARGDDVHVVVRPDTSLDRLVVLAGDADVYRLDLRDRTAVDGCLRVCAPDEIYHLAAATRRAEQSDLADAADSIEDLQTLTTLTVAAAAAPRPPRVLVRTGSLAEYGSGHAPFVETQREEPLTPYAAALVAATHWLTMIGPRLPFRAVTARLALIYGPLQSQQFLVAQLIANCLAGVPTILRRPSDRRDLMHVDDAVAGLLRLGAASRQLPAVINLSTGVAPAMTDVAARIVAATGAVPGLVSLADSGSAGGIPDFRAFPTLARETTGWRAAIDFATGLERTVAAQREATHEEFVPC